MTQRKNNDQGSTRKKNNKVSKDKVKVTPNVSGKSRDHRLIAQVEENAGMVEDS